MTNRVLFNACFLDRVQNLSSAVVHLGQIDGADDMDAVLGIQVVNPPPDSLDQMKVTTSNYDAEFGRSSGSFVSYTTKSGSNDFRGDLFEYLRNNFVDARNPYTEVIRQQPLRFSQFGGSFGGRVVPDKLFFFGTYQGQRERLGGGFQEFVPTAAELSCQLTSERIQRLKLASLESIWEQAIRQGFPISL